MRLSEALGVPSGHRATTWCSHGVRTNVGSNRRLDGIRLGLSGHGTSQAAPLPFSPGEGAYVETLEASVRDRVDAGVWLRVDVDQVHVALAKKRVRAGRQLPRPKRAGWRGCCRRRCSRSLENTFEAGGSIPSIACSLLRVQLSVSVVIPCYNQGRFLGEAIASAAAQRGLVSEIVVVDDGSTDETPAVATRDGSVTYLRQERRGLSEARNSGWRASSGDYRRLPRRR